MWSREVIRLENLNSNATRSAATANGERILGLSPKTDAQRMMQSRALEQVESVWESRLLMSEGVDGAIPWPFLSVLIFWICVLLLGFGLFAGFNPTITMALLVGSLTVAGAIFLILELNQPFTGLMRISDKPQLSAMAQSDQ